MRIILAPDSFKGTFRSQEVAAMLAAGCKRFFPEAEIICLPIADGGEGTADVFINALGFDPLSCSVSGPLEAPVSATLALKGETAVIEMAQASGLCLIAPGERNPMLTSTKGTGELILKALDAGARKIIVGIGGSATNDGGMGMAEVLGIRFFDSEGNALKGCGQSLEHIHTIDISGMDPRIRACEITAICDVKNPLTGPFGATTIYGPQKGADPVMIVALEHGMKNYQKALTALTGIDPNTIEGAGAAGGMGAAIALLLGGVLRPGIETVLDTVGFDEAAASADMVITGEGRLDAQSMFGKAPFGIARRCKGLRTKVFVLAGSVSGDLEALYQVGIDGVYPVVSEPCSEEEALNDAEGKLEKAIENMLRLLHAAYEIGRLSR